MAKQNPCPVPGCQRNRNMTSGYGVCRVHDEQFQGITYYMTQAQKEMNVKMKKQQAKGVRPGERITESGIILP